MDDGIGQSENASDGQITFLMDENRLGEYECFRLGDLAIDPPLDIFVLLDTGREDRGGRSEVIKVSLRF